MTGLSLENSRREFFKFLAASPLFAAAAGAQSDSRLAKPEDALSVMDFEDGARRALPPAHRGYMVTGVDDDATLRANSEGYKRIQLRPRRLVDVSQTDLKVELFGNTWDSPVFICPCGSQRIFHADGELATARAAKSKQTLMILSTNTSIAVEDVAKARGGPLWYQLYPTSNWDLNERMIRRAEASGCTALAVTVDQVGGRNTETMSRLRKQDTRDCLSCHPSAAGGNPMVEDPMYKGFDTRNVAMSNPALTWSDVDRLRKLTRMRLLLKGIVTGEDARLAVEHGVDGVEVSNHGGRAEESGRGTIECLAEVVEAVGGRVPVIVDGGVRRGTDVYKALALGARAVGIGRPYLWGLVSFGQAGVERVLDLLRAELALTMRQCGTPTLGQITKASVVTR
jgi:4-hydroxymandelate oxidase